MINLDYIPCVVRLSGLSTSAASDLGASTMHVAIDLLLNKEEEAQRRCAAATDALYEVIGATSEPAFRSSLLRLRRTFLNTRAPRTADMEQITTQLPAAVGAILRCANAAVSARADALAQVESAFTEAQARARQAMRDALSDTRLLDGLLLSSPTLFGNLPRYVRASHGRMAARDLQIERGLLRYLTRASMKATPFAAFCTVVSGRFVAPEASTGAESSGAGLYIHNGSIEARRRCVRLNKSLFGTLWEHVKHRPGIRGALTVELNPTLRHDAERLVFLAGFQRHEVFQRVASNDALALVIDTVRSRDGCLYDEVIDALVHHETLDTSTDNARAYLDGLTNLGLLRFRAPVRSQDADWALPFAHVLDSIDDDHARIIGQLLRDAERLSRLYAVASSAERAIVGRELTALIADVTQRLGLSAGREANLPLYEDCGADLTLDIRRSAGVDRALAALRGFIARVQPIANPRAEMATMRHFFDARYGSTVTSVPLLSFYEDFHREHFRDYLEKQAQLRGGATDAELRRYDFRNPFGLPAIERIHEAARAWTEAIRTAWESAPAAEEVNLCPTDVPVIDSVLPLSPSTTRSYSLFCQIASGSSDAEQVRLITSAGQIYLGFGKYFSRFLDLFAPSFTSELATRNSDFTHAMLAEISGDANFNANLHPPLLPFHIAYPTADGQTDHGALRVGDLVVSRLPDDPLALCLSHATSGQRVQPLDLGFLSPSMRPALYQLLMRFAPIGGHSVALPSSPQKGETERHSAHVLYRPRIVYDNAIVLARRRWSVPAALFPRREPGEAEFIYFLRLNRWRQSHGIPAAVYVRVLPHDSTPGSGVNREEMTPGEKDDSELPAELGESDSEVPSSAASPTSLCSERHGREDEDLLSSREGNPRLPGAKKTNKTSRGSRDFIKPQFIDFASPLLADLFGRIPATLTRFTVQIEERYPSNDALPEFAGERFASELIIQLDGQANEAGSAVIPSLAETR